MDISEQKIVIVGGSSGMGLAAAHMLSSAGAEVIIASRSQQRLDAALGVLPDGVVSAPMDFTDPESAEVAFASIGAFDHLVIAAAGAPAWGAFADVATDDVRKALETKLLGYWTTLRAAMPTLRRDGSATLLTGAAARATMPGTAGLAAVNGGIERMGLTLSKELAPLRVNVISPGLVDTPAYEGMPQAARDALFDGAARTLPVGRTGRPEDIAEAVLLMVSNGYITGAVLDVDGGAR